MRRLATIALALLPTTGLAWMSGCIIEGESDVPVVQADVGPGWYYDAEYYDEYHQFHPRAYYYYDGRRWDHRDAVPHGFVAHQRAHAVVRDEHHDERR